MIGVWCARECISVGRSAASDGGVDVKENKGKGWTARPSLVASSSSCVYIYIERGPLAANQSEIISLLKSMRA